MATKVQSIDFIESIRLIRSGDIEGMSYMQAEDGTGLAIFISKGVAHTLYASSELFKSKIGKKVPGFPDIIEVHLSDAMTTCSLIESLKQNEDCERTWPCHFALPSVEVLFN